MCSLTQDRPDYSQLLRQLEAGDIDKIEVRPDSFMTFQTAYMNFDHRKRIIGTASEGGVITYIYERDQTEKKSS
ncbi:hypothetical protein HCC74_00530 [Lentilactobacillus parabuchneri]|jgi:hypothetical protein|uniref:Uncharacterized protein n=1 Tax=Lentilactobacillus parabuchneri TaxID=152331 RepID=A0A844ELK2_9LACO|nr:hypothetical protein [Lentilactobacillus parabuchneri]MBW0245697.1 hypothetical protein [Lentilactobacillus parabuchneri]MBW0263765.1 hypothetical protein [Lentilactobacillus parabuchneri]MCT2884143.1 hypothetical protein [Lentilactobacillus parabuchneri]MSE22336.1 hypothetical protein [Lentilactobacillus parabuchneri]